MSACAVGVSLMTPTHAMASSRLESLKPIITPTLQMWNANTDERISVTFWKDGRYDRQALRRIDWFVRDWRQAETKEIDRDLLWALAAIREASMRDGNPGEIRFLSGYRSEKTNELLIRAGINAARNSFHIESRACDFSIPGVPVAPVFEYAKWLELGGCGHYRDSFIHMDTGDVRDWTQ